MNHIRLKATMSTGILFQDDWMRFIGKKNIKKMPLILGSYEALIICFVLTSSQYVYIMRIVRFRKYRQ